MRITIQRFVFLLLLTGRGIEAREAIAQPLRRPNIILVLTDDQGYGDLACLGNPWLKTPHLDQLHAQSTRLTNYHTGTTCAPTRASLLTGQAHNRLGVWHTIGGRSLLPPAAQTLPEYLRQHGYRTGLFGKWHLGDNYPLRPQDQGFDEVLMHGGGGVGQTPDYWGNDYTDDTYLHNGQPQAFTGYCTDVWFAEATRFIEQNQTRPFFCYISPNAPHSPYRVPATYREPYAQNPDVPNPDFYGMIANLDENMGRLMQLLEKQGLADNTILVPIRK
jgi:arylsulfatase A-like enzyme